MIPLGYRSWKDSSNAKLDFHYWGTRSEERISLMAKQPLAEVFGYPITNMSDSAIRARDEHLCPFGNRVPECTKDKRDDPLGVCSILGEDRSAIITCPVRFRQHGIIYDHAADFFFEPNAKWKSLPEVRLNDADEKSAGNIDAILVSLDPDDKIVDFGAVEIQSVYISGNVRNPFEHYMQDPVNRQRMDWSGHEGYPRADYLSSSRKRLAPQLLFKGGIMRAWSKKSAVVLNTGFFDTLPELKEVSKAEAEVAWLIFDLVLDQVSNAYTLTHHRSVYTKFDESLVKITTAKPGNMQSFIDALQKKL